MSLFLAWEAAEGPSLDSIHLQSPSMATTAGRGLCATAWVLLNFLAIKNLYLFPQFEVFIVLGMVVAVSPTYVLLIHWLDENFKLLGLRSLRELTKRRGSTKAKDASREDFRRTVRLQMAVITSGFAGTFLFFSIQLHFDLEERPPFIIEAMILLFFLASLFNILQIILSDFRLATKGEKDPAFRAIRKCLDWRLRCFRELSWHLLISPMILAIALIDFYFCLVVNVFYGLMLFFYYFLSGDQDALGFYVRNREKAAG